MMIGSVRDRHVLLPVTTPPTGAQDITLEFVVDTGSTGLLTLPPEAVAAMRLPFLHLIPAQLADGSFVEVAIHSATISWKRKPVYSLPASVLCLAQLCWTEATCRAVPGGRTGYGRRPVETSAAEAACVAFIVTNERLRGRQVFPQDPGVLRKRNLRVGDFGVPALLPLQRDRALVAAGQDQVEHGEGRDVAFAEEAVRAVRAAVLDVGVARVGTDQAAVASIGSPCRTGWCRSHSDWTAGCAAAAISSARFLPVETIVGLQNELDTLRLRRIRELPQAGRGALDRFGMRHVRVQRAAEDAHDRAAERGGKLRVAADVVDVALGDNAAAGDAAEGDTRVLKRLRVSARRSRVNGSASGRSMLSR